MFGPVGVPELLLIFVLALLLFGPRQMPLIGRRVGRLVGELRRASDELKRTVEEELAVEEMQQVQHDLADARREVNVVNLFTSPPTVEPTEGGRAPRAETP